jgi:hypothetical protein
LITSILGGTAGVMILLIFKPFAISAMPTRELATTQIFALSVKA